MRYKLSDSISFSTIPQHLKYGGGNNHQNQFLITDDNSNRKFFINATTKIFIQKFTTPKTFAALTKEIAKEVNASLPQVKKLVQPFFKYIRYRHFIVPENFASEKQVIRPLFNPSSILRQYSIEQIIDTNENIDIYKGIDLNNENNVVIKLLKKHSKAEAASLKREFDFLKTLNKAGIAPKAYKFYKEENFAWFVQDFIDGLSLPQLICQKKDSTLNFILHVISEVLIAFKKIHTVSIVHGDIHPSNIIVTKENKIKIIDFGLSLHNGLDKDEVVNFGGAYFFMPPERIKTTSYKKFIRKPDFYSDVFQLGVVLFVLLYDKYPFNGITWEQLATEIKEKPIRFPAKSQYNFSVPAWLKKIIQKCVAKKPKERFANASELYVAYLKNITHAGKARSTVEI